MFPEITGYEKQEQRIAGCNCIIYSKMGSDHGKAIVYYAGGGYIRYQLPSNKSTGEISPEHTSLRTNHSPP